ncbi:MAG: hypothetical protein VW270_04330 [Candidatus Poseidoniales archaeon]
MALLSTATGMLGRGAVGAAKGAGALFAAPDADALAAAYVGGKVSSAVGGIRSSVVGGVKRMFGSETAPQQSSGDSGSPRRSQDQPLTEKTFKQFEAKLFSYMNSLIGFSDQELQAMKDAELRNKERLAEQVQKPGQPVKDKPERKGFSDWMKLLGLGTLAGFLGLAGLGKLIEDTGKNLEDMDFTDVLKGLGIGGSVIAAIAARKIVTSFASRVAAASAALKALAENAMKRIKNAVRTPGSPSKTKMTTYRGKSVPVGTVVRNKAGRLVKIGPTGAASFVAAKDVKPSDIKDLSSFKEAPKAPPGSGKPGSPTKAKEFTKANVAKSAKALVAKQGIKIAAKSLPFGLGTILGSFFAIQRLAAGDYVGAGLDFAAGVTAFKPGLGTAASLALAATSIARDLALEYFPDSDYANLDKSVTNTIEEAIGDEVRALLKVGEGSKRETEDLIQEQADVSTAAKAEGQRLGRGSRQQRQQIAKDFGTDALKEARKSIQATPGRKKGAVTAEELDQYFYGGDDTEASSSLQQYREKLKSAETSRSQSQSTVETKPPTAAAPTGITSDTQTVSQDAEGGVDVSSVNVDAGTSQETVDGGAGDMQKARSVAASRSSQLASDKMLFARGAANPDPTYMKASQLAMVS